MRGNRLHRDGGELLSGRLSDLCVCPVAPSLAPNR